MTEKQVEHEIECLEQILKVLGIRSRWDLDSYYLQTADISCPVEKCKHD